VDANTNGGIELVVTSGYRSEDKQWELVAQNCPCSKEKVDGKCPIKTTTATSAKECRPPTCIPTGDGSNCNHTTGNAVDVKGRLNGTQCARGSNCEKAVANIMKKNGFCVLTSEPWHFELKSHVKETKRLDAFYCP
jgi:D-alanyl-D-alanine dipeptidase